MCCTSATAQEKLFNNANVQSPVVNPDGTVTFNLFAPKAVKVEVTGDFLPTRTVEVPGRGTYDAPGVAPEGYGLTLPTNSPLSCTATRSISMV